MRLLKRENSGWLVTTYTFSLTHFNPRDIPSEYAILSHRWGPDEVTLKDIENGTAKTKHGYRKLEFCAEQAACDGLLYFWIDTCCIDKTNNVELSEAINSMFKWYQNARKCYVYLPDVSMVDSAGAIATNADWAPAFQKSEWFTRGWTLQELIAPKVVEFFSMEGKKLGDKISLEGQINQITGISVEALRGKPLHEVDEKERFSWTAKRETTIEEDAVYCLLGLFDIQMPLVYSEGQQKALARLQRKIQKSSRLNSFVAQDAPWIVPFERNPLFTGRETQLDDLERRLFAHDYTSKIAVTGLGGMGKTQLVLELLFKTKKKHPDCSIIWIPATNPESLRRGYLAAAQKLDIPESGDDRADIRKLVQDYLSRREAGPWVLVFDNADDIDMWTTAVQSRTCENVEVSGQRSEIESNLLIDFLPRNKRGCIIFTTRDRKAAVDLAPLNIIPVQEMSEESAMELLKKHLVDLSLVDDQQNAAALLTALTCLPLAIIQAAAYIKKHHCTLSDYLGLLGENEQETIDLLSAEFEDYGRYRDVKNPVATTWLISFDQIRRTDPLAAEYLSFMACIDPKDIPQSLLPLGPSRNRELEAIGTLDAYSFVSRRPMQASLDLHRLVHLATRNWLRREGLLSQWTLKTVLHLEKVFPDDDHNNRSVWRIYLPHVQQALESDLISIDGKERLALMLKYGHCLCSDGRWNEAESAFKQVLAIRKEMFGEESLSMLATINDLALTYQNQGRWVEAEELGVQVMKTRITKLGAEHLHTLTSMNNLALTYWNQGRWAEAEQLQEQVIKSCTTKQGADHPDTLTSMANLASTYWNQGRLDEAEQLDAQVMKTRTMKLGADHPDTLTSMSNLASTYGNQGRWAEAEELQKQVMKSRITKLGADHPATLTSMGNLASTYRDQGRWAEAEELQEQVMKACITKLGADHPNTLSIMGNLASTYGNQGRWAEAEELQEQVMKACITKQGADHPDTLTSMGNLAVAYQNQGRWAEAEELQEQVMKACITKQGADHPNTLTSMGNLASTYWNQGLWAEAEELEEQVMQGNITKLGADHPHTLMSMNNLAFTWKGLSRDAEAIQLMQDCIQRRIRVLGPRHPDSLSSQFTLEAWKASHSGDPSEA